MFLLQKAALHLPLPPVLALILVSWLVPAQGEEAAYEAAPLIVSQDHAWPPFAFLDPEGVPRGLFIDLWREIGQRMGRPVEFRLVDWPDSIAQVRAGRAHVHGGLIPSPERRTFLDFSTELLPLQAFAFVSSASLATGLEDLRGLPVGVTAGSYEAEFMGREHPGIELREFRNNERMILAAVRGEIQAFVADYPVGMYLLDRHATPADFRPLRALYSQPLVAGVVKGDAELLQAIDAAIAGIDPDELRRLIQRWMRSEKVEVLPAWALVAGAITLVTALLALFTLMLYRQRAQLAREVAERTADLSASEEKFRVLFESAAVSVMVHDRHTCEVIDANQRALESYGVKDKTSLHEMDIWADPPYAFADVQRWFARVRDEGPQRFEWMSCSVTGKMFWEDVSLHEVILRGVPRIVSTSVDITERKALEARMTHLAHYDPLTDLPNRLLFFDRVEQALIQARRAESALALMLLDLDEFKPVNDEHGHAIGDLLLQEAARRMKECLRASDTVGRIGGDEFVILLPVIEHQEDARQVAEKIREELCRPFRLAGKTLQISCSIGIALCPEHGTSVIELSKHADHAMYAAKQQGRNGWRFYQAGTRAREAESVSPL